MKKETKLVTMKLDISKNAETVLARRYLKKDTSGKAIESPEEMFQRVASHIALAEKKYTDKNKINYFQTAFYNLMVGFKFIPNSPTLMNAGNELGQLAACFVLPIEDSLSGIFETVKNAGFGDYVEFDPTIVRGLDYYTKTVFEFWPQEFEDGAQSSLGGGGRYDYLVKTLGGSDTPAVGFACGIDRMVLEMRRQDTKAYYPASPKV